jgi:hypothetical protein
MEGREEPNIGKYKEIMNDWNYNGSCTHASSHTNLQISCPNYTACNKNAYKRHVNCNHYRQFNIFMRTRFISMKHFLNL